MFSRLGLINLQLTRRMYSTPTFHEKCRIYYKQNKNKNSNDFYEGKIGKKKESYKHMYKHLPIKSFENQYNDINKTENN